MSFDIAQPRDLRIRANGSLPQIKQTRPRETGILCPLAFLKQVSPGIAVNPTTGDAYDLAPFKLHFSVRKSTGEMACRPRNHPGGVFIGNQGRHRMAEQVPIARLSGKPVAAAIVVLLPVSPRDIGP